MAPHTSHSNNSAFVINQTALGSENAEPALQAYPGPTSLLCPWNAPVVRLNIYGRL
jgi:hypothetical protein